MKTRLISILYIFISALILISCQPSGTLTEDSQSNENTNTPPLPKSESNYPTVISSTNGRRGVTPGNDNGSDTGGDSGSDTGDFWWGNNCRPPAYSSNKYVTDNATFLAALKNAKPGDIVFLEPGRVFKQARSACMDIVGVRGTAGNPIIVTSSSVNPATISGGECGLAVLNSSYVEISNIKITGQSHWGIDLGGLKEGKGRPTGVNNITVKNLEVGHTGIEGIMINSASHHVNVLCSEVHHTGLTTPIYGEGIYVGDGSSHDATHHVKIAYNHIHHTNSEAVDVKQSTTYVEVLYNYIHDIDLNSQGAITLGIDSFSYPSGEYKVIGNRIHNITGRNYDGAGITIGHGNTWVSNNVIWNIPDYYGIYTQQNFANPSANKVYIYNNTVVNAASGPLGINIIGANRSGPSEVFTANNLWESNSSGDLRATTADFITTQGLADSGKGPGSGLQLKSTSKAPNKTSSTQVVSKDILGRPRPNGSGISYGAFQHGAM